MHDSDYTGFCLYNKSLILSVALVCRHSFDRTAQARFLDENGGLL
ncbi:hypothetical protein [Nonomuraea longispora]|nr:hypothetical protein [Nonomuraea longispora]